MTNSAGKLFHNNWAIHSKASAAVRCPCMWHS